MTLRKVFLFILGVGIGALMGPIWEQYQYAHAQQEELALGDFLYRELRYYSQDKKVANITKRLERLVENKEMPQPQEACEQILMNIATDAVEKEAEEHLAEANEYINKLKDQPNSIPIIEDKVYIEILEKGLGEEISSNDTVSLRFKQYDMDDKILKDTEDQAFVIPISQMIKGFQLGIAGAKLGEKRKIYIHPDYGFSQVGRGNHSNQLLIYEIILVGKPSFE